MSYFKLRILQLVSILFECAERKNDPTTQPNQVENTDINIFLDLLRRHFNVEVEYMFELGKC